MNQTKDDKAKLNANPWYFRLIGMGTKYFVKTPAWLMSLYPKRLWRVNTKEKIIYLTFDDGPETEATVFVLDELKKYNARATFFCIGKNVATYPQLYKRILDEGHSVGNHSYTHQNGWKTENQIYLSDITEAAKLINSPLYRPPYGRIRSSQAKKIKEAMKNKDAKIVMWDVLSGDFDSLISAEKCKSNVMENAKPGSIIVFHDSVSAFRVLKAILPELLGHFEAEGYSFRSL